MIKKKQIPTILGVIVLIVGIVAGVFLLRQTQLFKIGATPTISPKNVRVSNVTDSSATISWTTEGETTAFIFWGESEGNPNQVVNEGSGNQKYINHTLDITGLKANSTYYYKINSDGTDFDNNGIPWQFATGSTLSAKTSSVPVSGSVITAAGAPARRALVYIDIEGYLLSTTTSDEGNFILQIGDARTTDFRNYVSIDPKKTLLNVSVQAENGEVASAQIFPESANPIPPLILGQSKDYRNLIPAPEGTSPNVDLNLPSGATDESKFNVSSGSGKTKPVTVILESITEGETVTSTEPEFFGKGPAGKTISITINSEQIIESTVKIPSDGSWSYVPNEPLTPGTHSVTISWLDSTGITRTLTRNFVVQAGELPAFSASGSGTTPTPTATPRITPTATPRITPTPISTPARSATPAATARATTQPVPVTGDLTPTVLLSIMGIAVLAFSLFVWRSSEA